MDQQISLQKNENYNPVEMAKSGVDPFDIYEAEFRDSEWASKVEGAIWGQLSKDVQWIVPEAQHVTVVCRFATCKLSMDVSRGSVDRARSSFTVAQYGDGTAYAQRSHESLDGGKVRVSAIALFHETRELNKQAALYVAKRSLFFEHVGSDDPVYGELVRHEKLAEGR